MLKLAWRNIILKPLTSSLSAILFAISITIIILLNIVSYQLNEKFAKNRDDVHLVVGAPGSKMDLILSSVYHISPPIQNVTIDDVDFILRDPSVTVVPLALGDHYAFDPDPDNGSFEDVEQRRIVGTDTSYLSLYNVGLEKGRTWEKPMEVTIGQEVHSLGLDIGDTFVGTHGVGTPGGHVHADQLYTVVGILESSGTVLDQLILCSVQSVWSVHHEGHGHNQGPKMTNKAKEKAPPNEHIQTRRLTNGQIDSLNALINEKLGNIDQIEKPDSFNIAYLKSTQKDIRLNALRIRSNIKSITSAIKLLNDHYQSARLFDYISPDTNITFSIEDSLSIALQADYQKIEDYLKDLRSKIDRGELHRSYQMAKEVEQVTYNVINGFEGLHHDSILKAKRKQYAMHKFKFRDHYLLDYPEQEITSLLITFEGGRGIELQRIIEEYHPNLNAALVEAEVQKLYEIIEPGVVYIKMLAYLIMIISGISVLISLVKALRERKYELALMRVMGATRLKIFSLVIMEGILLALVGFALGFMMSHLLAEIMAGVLEDRYHYDFTGFIFLKSERLVFLGTVGIGFVAALLPAIMAMYTNISATLSNK